MPINIQPSWFINGERDTYPERQSLWPVILLVVEVCKTSVDEIESLDLQEKCQHRERGELAATTPSQLP
jgi:hypothetical protein